MIPFCGDNTVGSEGLGINGAWERARRKGVDARTGAWIIIFPLTVS